MIGIDTLCLSKMAATPRIDIAAADIASMMPTAELEASTVNLDADAILRMCYLCIGILGMLGNLLVIVVLLNSRHLLKAVTNLLIMNQSALDFTASFLIITTSFLRNIDSITTPVGKEIFCRVWLTNLPVWGIFLSSTYNLVTITMERYFAIVYPLKLDRRLTRRKVYLLMAAIWMLGPTYNALFMVPTSRVQGGVCTVYTVWPNALTQRATGLLTVLVQFVVPIILIVFAYIRIAVVLKNSTGGATGAYASSNRDERIRRARQNVIKTLLLVSACFVLCWIWNQVYYLLFNLGYDKIDFNSAFYHFTVIAVFCNCCLNPIIYSLKYQQFQKAVKKLFYCGGDMRRSVCWVRCHRMCSHCPCCCTPKDNPPIQTIFYIPKHLLSTSTGDSTIVSTSLGSDIEHV